MDNGSALHDVVVAELVNSSSQLGLGLALGVPGMLLQQLGATVVRVVGEDVPLDDGIE